MRILGVITDRLLKQHGENSAGWNPGRASEGGSSGGKTQPVPKGVQGTSLGRGGDRRKR